LFTPPFLPTLVARQYASFLASLYAAGLEHCGELAGSLGPTKPQQLGPGGPGPAGTMPDEKRQKARENARKNNRINAR